MFCSSQLGIVVGPLTYIIMIYMIHEKKMMMMAPYYCRYRYFTRPSDFNVLQRGGRLFQQFGVDIDAAIDQGRKYLENNQSKLRADMYCGLDDILPTDGHTSPVHLGWRVCHLLLSRPKILPPNVLEFHDSGSMVWEAYLIHNVYGQSELG